MEAPLKVAYNRIGPRANPLKAEGFWKGRVVPSEPAQDQRKIAKILLDEMKRESPEWLQELAETRKLNRFITFHVERASALYRKELLKDPRTILSENPMLLLIHMAAYLTSDPVFDSQRRNNCPRHKADPVSEEGEVETDGSDTEVAEGPDKTGKTFFIVEGFSIEWNDDGLRIRAIEYHSTELTLRWDYIEGLAKAAQKNPVRKNAGLATGDVRGKLL